MTFLSSPIRFWRAENRVRGATVVTCVALALALSGCERAEAPNGEGARVTGSAASSAPEALARLIDGGETWDVEPVLAEGEAPFLAVAEKAPGKGVEVLDRAIGGSAPIRAAASRPASKPLAALTGGTGAPLRRSAARPATVPGVHEPIIVFDQPTEATGVARGMEVRVVGRTTLEMVDQVASYRSTLNRTGRRGEVRALKDERSTRVEVPACVADSSSGWAGNVSNDRVVELVEGESTVRLETKTRATAHRGAEGGPVELTDLRVEATRTVTNPDGSTTVDRGTLSGTVASVTLDSDPGGAETAGLRVTDATPWFATESGNIFLSAVVSLVPEMNAALKVAADAHEGSGLCVRLVADARGVTTLAPGVGTPVDAEVVDSRTGEPLGGSMIQASGDRGEPAPEEFTSAGTTVFTAGTIGSPYTLSLSTSSPRGGDSTSVVFSGGWAFDGVVLKVTTEGASASQTWSGFVCGDPLKEPWSFTQVADGMGEITFERAPFAMEERPGGWGQVPMIEPLAGTASGEPPFRLYIDDVEPPEVTPRHQRVEAQVYPAGAGECG